MLTSTTINFVFRSAEAIRYTNLNKRHNITIFQSTKRRISLLQAIPLRVHAVLHLSAGVTFMRLAVAGTDLENHMSASEHKSAIWEALRDQGVPRDWRSKMARVLGSTINIFFSLLLGAIAFVFVAVQFPELMDALLNSANWLKYQIGDTGLDPRYNVWLRSVLNEHMVVFLGLVIVMRIIQQIVIGAMANILGFRTQH